MLVFVLAATGNSSIRAQTPGKVLYGFTGFPHDVTPTSEDEIHEIIIPNSNIYAIHMDHCLPWREALNDGPFPQWLTQEWDRIKSRIPEGRPVYIALTPTAMNRYTLAEPCGPAENIFGTMPRVMRGATFDDANVTRAYANYVRRVVEAFNPTYLILGIEISEMLLTHPEVWPAYETLVAHIRSELRTYHPQAQVGIEVVLQTLMRRDIADKVKPIVEASDFIGISFYPYATEYGEAIGLPALPSGAQQWLFPLQWLRTYTAKPIAICETGYTTKEIKLPTQLKEIAFNGDEATQAAYLRDLIRIAKQDHYLFVIWFVPADYERLLASKNTSEDSIERIWVNAGLFDSSLQPKLAWTEWAAWEEDWCCPRPRGWPAGTRYGIPSGNSPQRRR